MLGVLQFVSRLSEPFNCGTGECLKKGKSLTWKVEIFQQINTYKCV